ncbi:MAG: nucleotide exchange factor GrpE, partial [Treponema sp.]|nr:nucleotide exchange factor GrpE [Treponema sp.]
MEKTEEQIEMPKQEPPAPETDGKENQEQGGQTQGADAAGNEAEFPAELTPEERITQLESENADLKDQILRR